MKTLLAGCVLVITSIISLPSQAAQIKFDIGSIAGVFSSAPLTGSFTLNTSDQSLNDIGLASGAGSFASGFGIDNADGFGLRKTSFFFNGDAQLLFEIDSFDRFMPDLSVGETILLSIFASQGNDFDSNYVNQDIFGANTDLFQGQISATRLAEVQVSVPALGTLLALCMGGLLLNRRD